MFLTLLIELTGPVGSIGIYGDLYGSINSGIDPID